MCRPLVACLTLFVVLPLIAQRETACGQTNIRYKFAEGQKLLYKMKQETKNVAKPAAEGVEFTTTMNQTTEMIWEIKSVDEEGNAVIDQSIRRMILDIDVPAGLDIYYDSASDDEPVGPTVALLKPTLDVLVGAKFEVTMSARGEVLKLVVPEDVVAAIAKMPNAALMGELSTKEGFEKMITQSSLKFPEDELTVGKEWASTFEVENEQLGKQSIETAYRYEGPVEEEDQALEKFAVSVTLDLGSGEAGSPVEITKQDSSGTILFDREAGRMKSANIKMAMSMAIKVGEQTIGSNLDQTVSVTVAPVEE